MEVLQEIGNFGNKSGVYTDAVKTFFNQFAEPVRIENKISWRRNRMLKVGPFCRFQEIELPVELADKIGAINFRDVSDDGLLEMFSSESLSLMDLCVLAESCTRFHKIVRCIFPTKLEFQYKADRIEEHISKDEIRTHIQLRPSVVRSIEYSSDGTETSRQEQGDDAIETILRNFGPVLREITLDSNYNLADQRASVVLNLMSKYCVVDALVNPAVVAVKSKPMFSQLQVLVLNRINVYRGFDAFANFDSLIELRVRHVIGRSSVMKVTFPKLERLFFEDRLVNEGALQNFISRQTKLKILHIRLEEIDENYNIALLQGICKSCQELERLSLDFGHKTKYCILPLQSLKRLNSLELSHGIIPPKTEHHELRSIELYAPRTEFDYLKQLKRLRINHWSSDIILDVVDIIKRLVNLQLFQIEVKSFLLSENIFAQIVRIVKGRPNVLTLKCRYNFFYDLENFDEHQHRVRLEL